MLVIDDSVEDGGNRMWLRLTSATGRQLTTNGGWAPSSTPRRAATTRRRWVDRAEVLSVHVTHTEGRNAMSAVAASRREVMTSLALGAGTLTAVVVPTTAAEAHPVPDDTLGDVQQRLRSRLLEYLGERDPVSADGVNRTLIGLRDAGVIGEADRTELATFVDEVENSSSAMDDISSWFSSIYDYTIGRVSVLVRRMLEYAKEKFEAVRDVLTDLAEIKNEIISALSLMLSAASIAPVIGWPTAALAVVLGVGVLFLPDEIGVDIVCRNRS